MHINFNQKVNVPFNFIKEEDIQNITRMLRAKMGGIFFSEIDSSDIFNTFIIQKSAENPADLAYDIKIDDWT